MKLYQWGQSVASFAGASSESPAAEREWWASLQALPTLPSVLFRFLGLVGDPQKTTEEMAEFICQDPALLARVLPLLPEGFSAANSGGTSLRQAVGSLDRERMRALAHTTPLIRTLEPAAAGAFTMILWERSLLCAHT